MFFVPRGDLGLRGGMIWPLPANRDCSSRLPLEIVAGIRSLEKLKPGAHP